jgi:hypothetical protein
MFFLFTIHISGVLNDQMELELIQSYWELAQELLVLCLISYLGQFF